MYSKHSSRRFRRLVPLKLVRRLPIKNVQKISVLYRVSFLILSASFNRRSLCVHPFFRKVDWFARALTHPNCSFPLASVFTQSIFCFTRPFVAEFHFQQRLGYCFLYQVSKESPSLVWSFRVLKLIRITCSPSGVYSIFSRIKAKLPLSYYRAPYSVIRLSEGRHGDVNGIMKDDDLAAAEYLRWAGDDEEICENCSANGCCSSGQSSVGKDLPPINSVQLICCSRVGRLCIAFMILLTFYLFYLAIVQSDPSRSVSGFGEVAAPKISFNASRPIEILSTLCSAYSRHEVSGDACMRLCFKDKWEVTEFYEGNKVVIVVKDGGQQAVFKSAHPFIDDFRPTSNDENEDVFTDHVLDRVNDLLRLGWPSHYKKHLVETVWPSLLRTPGQPLTKADRKSLSALLQQDEYVTFRVIPLSRVTPKVIGTCGHFYQTETLVAFRMKGYYMNLKGKILVHLMGTLKLFYEFLNEPLQWCDARFDNLGLSADYPKRFVIMDGDLLYTESRLNALFHQKPCVTDDDCVIGDCRARCTADMVCGNRMNENLDIFCEKLVNPMFGNSWSKGNKYLAACHDTTANFTKKLNELRLTWSWSLSEV